MNENYSTQDFPATPEYVLDVFRDNQRFTMICGLDPVLEFDTTVQDWCATCDLYGWPTLFNSLNETWGIHATRSEWKRVLKPEKQRTLREVCEFIATRAIRPKIRPATLLGKECLPAGAFLTIRSILAQAGADPRRIAPSAPLEPYLNRHIIKLYMHIAKIAPGTFPEVNFESHPLLRTMTLVVLLGVLTLIVGGMANSPSTLIIGTGFAAIGVLGHICVSRMLGPGRFELSDTVTFRDLAVRICQPDAKTADKEPNDGTSR